MLYYNYNPKSFYYWYYFYYYHTTAIHITTIITAITTISIANKHTVGNY